ncbi:MAG TPA: hemerythrin domain-containing protein [Candidatus Kryptonia bacterium]
MENAIESTRTAGRLMNPHEKLHAHHEKLIRTILQLADLTVENPPDASLLLSYCGEYLLPHADAEEITLYAASNDKKFVQDLVLEHVELKHVLGLIHRGLTTRDVVMITTEAHNFTSLLKSHFDEEETCLMPALEKYLKPEQFQSLIETAHRLEAEKKRSDLTALFELDHKRIDMNISYVIDPVRSGGKIREHYSSFRKQLLKHIELEETVLFPAFEESTKTGGAGPVQVMIQEHKVIVSLISDPPDQMKESEITATTKSLISRLVVHNKKEEMILYPMISGKLTGTERGEIFRVCFEGFRSV